MVGEEKRTILFRKILSLKYSRISVRKKSSTNLVFGKVTNDFSTPQFGDQFVRLERNFSDMDIYWDPSMCTWHSTLCY